MLLDSVEDVHAVLAVNHVHCQAPLAKAARAPDPVQVGLVVRVPVLVHGEVKVDDNRNLFNINTCMKGRCRAVRTGTENPCPPSEAGTHQLRLEGSVWGWPALGFGDRGHAAEPRGKENFGKC